MGIGTYENRYSLIEQAKSGQVELKETWNARLAEIVV
jgi:hypothetical protein